MYSPEAQAVISTMSNADLFTIPDNPISLGQKEVAPWGGNNNLPLEIIDKITASEVVGSNLWFNISSSYGMGIKPFLRRIVDGKTHYEECVDERVLSFFDNNDIDGYFLEQVTDMMTYSNVFPELIVSRDGREIVSLRHLEAVFSRWGSIARNETEIMRHYYLADWTKPDGKLVVETPVLSRYYTCDHLREQVLANKNNRRFVMQISMPTPGRTYYANPWWWSIFKSGWYDLSTMIPLFKKALLKNHLAVRYVIYISDEYWDIQAKRLNISPDDVARFSAMQQDEARRIIDFLKNEDGKGGGLISSKKSLFNSAGKGLDDRFIEIVPIKPEIEGGEFIEDSEEANNIISYAMGVHPNLNGATPGKTSGSLGGSDKRELYMIKQAMMRPYRDRLLKPLQLIKQFNNWPKELVFGVPEYQFPTLDVSKNGVVESNQNPK